MAGSSVIGALRVVLGADSAELESGFKRAQKSSDDFGAGLAKAAGAAALAVATMATAIGVGIKRTIDEADKLGKMAQSIGIPVEELSKLKHAADLSGVGLEALGTSVGKLAKTMVEAAAKPTSEAANAFNALGVSVTNADGTLKSSTQVMTDVAGKFENLKDGAGKTAISMALFGRSGKDMIPMLNAGRDGLNAMMREADQLGIVIDSKTAKSAEAFNDNLTRLGKVKDGIITKITAGMLPSLEKLSIGMVRVAKDTGSLQSWGETIGSVFTSLFNATERLSLAWQRIGIEWQAFKNFMTTPFSMESWNKFNATGAESLRLLENLRIVQETAGLADAFGPIGTSAAAAGKKLDDLNYRLLAGKTAMDAFFAAQIKQQLNTAAQVAAMDMNTGAQERMRVTTQAFALAQQNNIPITDALRMKITETANAAEQMAIKLKGAHLIQQNKEPHEKYREELASNEAAMIRQGATAEQIARMQQRLAEQYQVTWQQVGANVAGTFATIAGVFGKENKAMFIAAKAGAIAQAMINAHLAISKALATVPIPANFAAAAAIGAAAFAQVASIVSTSMPSFRTGGAMMVPGGMGGGDSVLMQAMVEPGEQIDIWRPGQGGGDPRRGGGVVNHVINGLDAAQFYSGSAVRKLIENINEAVGDGARLKFT